MKSLVAMFSQRSARLCRDCGDSPCVCNDAAEDRELSFRRRLRTETEIAFAEARAESAAFWARVEREGGGECDG